MQGNGAAPVLWMIIYIILVRHLYLKGLDTPQYSPISKLMFVLITLAYVDDTDLNVLNIQDKYNLEVLEMGQKILDALQFALSVSRDDFKLDKCSWKMQDCYWKEV